MTNNQTHTAHEIIMGYVNGILLGYSCSSARPNSMVFDIREQALCVASFFLPAIVKCILPTPKTGVGWHCGCGRGKRSHRKTSTHSQSIHEAPDLCAVVGWAEEGRRATLPRENPTENTEHENIIQQHPRPSQELSQRAKKFDSRL